MPVPHVTEHPAVASNHSDHAATAKKQKTRMLNSVEYFVLYFWETISPEFLYLVNIYVTFVDKKNTIQFNIIFIAHNVRTIAIIYYKKYFVVGVQEFHNGSRSTPGCKHGRTHSRWYLWSPWCREIRYISGQPSNEI